jgi:hypothetical protein
MLARGEILEVLRRSTARLAEDPEQTALRSHQETALHRLRVRIGEAIAARQWEPARRLAAEGLSVVSDDEVLRGLAGEARDGRLRELVSQGENALAERRLDEARPRCQEALAIDPAHRPALELRRRIEIAETVDPDVADEAFDAVRHRRRSSTCSGSASCDRRPPRYGRPRLGRPRHWFGCGATS